MSESPTYA